MTEQQRRADRLGLGVAYGLIAGAALGAVLMALTGAVVWVWVGPGFGLLVGLVVTGLLTGGSHEEQDRSDEDATDGVA